MQFHLSVCSDRRMVEKERYGAAPRAAIGSTSALTPSLPPRCQSALRYAALQCNIPFYSNEDWEEEATVGQSYDPSARWG